ncbi:MAG: portal protein [Lentimonas sp.]
MSEYSNEQVTEEFVSEESIGEDEIQSIVTESIEDAVDFIDNTISPARAEAAEYYNGEPFGNEQEGRSTAMTMDVRDTVQAMLPSLVRIFCSSDHVVEYAPQGPEDLAVASQATDYANYILNQDQDQSYIEILYAVFKDALVKGSGFLKYYWDESEEVQTYKLSGLDEQALAALNSDPNVDVTSLETASTDTFDSPDGQQEQLFTVSVTHRRATGKVKVAAVPPEEILVSRHARSFADADLIAHRRYSTVSELVGMGYEFDDIIDFATDDEDFDLFNVEARERQLSQESRNYADPTRRRVLYVEAYMRIDMDGDGIGELRKICCAGPTYEILRNDPCDDIPFSHFCPDPEPHAFFGMSIADLTMDIQRIKSAVLRASLDSLAMSTHPRVGVVEGQASLEDVMNVEAGGIIRMRSPGAVIPFNLPYVGQDAFPMMAYLDEMRENRTGISRAADGLAPEALQSSTLAAVNQTIQAAQQRTEMIARLFAENGMSRLFRGILKLIVAHQDRPRMIRLRNEFVQMAPDVWNANMDVVANVSLGKGGDQERLMMLQQIAQKQEQLLQQLGPDNPIVNAQNYYATMTQMLELAGFKDINRFFTDPSKYQPQEKPEQPDPNAALIQVQMQSIQADIQKKQAELELEREKMMREDDRRRDKDEADIALRAAEIAARFGAQVDTAAIRAGSERDREAIRQLTSVSNGQNGAPVS